MKRYLWAVYVFMFIATAGTNTLAPVMFLLLALWYFPKFNSITEKVSFNFIEIVKKKASEKGQAPEEKAIATSIKVLVGLIVLFSFWIPFTTNTETPTATQNTQQVEVKKTTYTPEQIKASKELIEGLRSKEVGLITKMYEGDKGYWRVVIDENIWKNIPYENKQQLPIATKIYIENVENGTVKAIWGLGAYDNLLYFNESNVYSKPRKLL